MAATTGGESAGDLLRVWRQRRRLSQLEVASRTGVSMRHLSCVETGKANASRQLLLYLAAELQIPLRDRNVLLLSAGYAPHHPHRPLAGPELQAAQALLAELLARHEPYPAVVTDRHWNIVERNASAKALTAGVADHLAQSPANALRTALHPEGLAPRITNLAEWSAHLLGRLRQRITFTADPVLIDLEREVLSYPGVAHGEVTDVASQDIFVPLRIMYGGVEIHLLNTLTTFGAALDVTLAELVLESFYPADAATAEVMRAASQAVG
jgi:transcriptional regulator with XRE-family HTH domain